MYRVRNIVIMLAAFTCLSAFALREDRDKKMHIIADVWNYNYKTGITIFEGNVKVDQGTTHITADKVVTKRNSQHEIEEAIAYGIQTQAHYWTLTKIGEQEMHAHANIIKYYPITSNVTLKETVLVQQGENSFQGQLIHYNMNDETITFPESKEGRAVIVYNPDKN